MEGETDGGSGGGGVGCFMLHVPQDCKSLLFSINHQKEQNVDMDADVDERC